VISSSKKFAAVVCLAGASTFGGVILAQASSASPALSHLKSNGTGRLQTASLGGPLVINVVTSNLGSFTATCTGISTTFNIPKATQIYSTPMALITQPSGQPIDVTGCTDSLGGTDTITSAGHWQITYVRVGTKNKLKVQLPLNAATLSSSILPACVLALNTSTTSSWTLKYNNPPTGVGTGTIKAGQVPGVVTPGGGCPSGMTVTETLNTDTLTASPGFHFVP
jgi:hypothetical protein